MNIRHTLLAGSVVLALASLTACGSTPPVATAAPAPAVQQTASAQAASAAYDFDMDVFHPVVARNGMVATEQELATKVGVEGHHLTIHAPLIDQEHTVFGHPVRGNVVQEPGNRHRRAMGSIGQSLGRPTGQRHRVEVMASLRQQGLDGLEHRGLAHSCTTGDEGERKACHRVHGLALGGVQGILLTVIHHVAVWRDHQIAVFALHLHGLRADNHIVTRRDATLVVRVRGQSGNGQRHRQQRFAHHKTPLRQNGSAVADPCQT